MERNAEPCVRIENDLPLFVGGELDPVSARELARHLEGCEPCRARERRAMTAHRALAQGLDAVPGAHGPDLWPGLRAQLLRDGLLRPAAPVTSEAGRAAVLPGRRAFSGPWRIAAAAAVVLVGAWAARDWMQRGPDDCVDPGTGLVDQGRRGHEPIVAQPVSDGRLRPLGVGERPLQEGAATLGLNDEPRLFPSSRRGETEAPAGLIQVKRGW